MDFGKVVYGIDDACYQNVINSQLLESKVSKIEDFSISDLQKVVIRFKDLADVPSDPFRQLELIIIASIKSWHDSKNVQRRRDMGLSDAKNAITIQSMVYGNLNQRSGNGSLNHSLTHQLTHSLTHSLITYLENAQPEILLLVVLS